MARLVERIKEALPGVFIHSIMIGRSPEDDRKRSLIDNMNRQIEEVCDQLSRVPELADGFHAIGLSQGGQFLRAYVERCNRPRVKKLITLGSQHQGVMALPGCVENESSRGALGIEEAEAQAESEVTQMNFFQYVRARTVGKGSLVDDGKTFLAQLFALFKSDENCGWWKRLLKLGVYSPFVRSQVVQAQYFKDPANLSAYFQHNQFLIDINNDTPDETKRNATYVENMRQLDGFYMYIFEGDTVVVPKESGWFALHDPKDSKIKYLKDLSIYREDRLGLKGLDESGRLYFRMLPGEHLKLSNEFIRGELADTLRD